MKFLKLWTISVPSSSIFYHMIITPWYWFMQLLSSSASQGWSKPWSGPFFRTGAVNFHPHLSNNCPSATSAAQALGHVLILSYFHLGLHHLMSTITSFVQWFICPHSASQSDWRPRSLHPLQFFRSSSEAIESRPHSSPPHSDVQSVSACLHQTPANSDPTTPASRLQRVHVF